MIYTLTANPAVDMSMTVGRSAPDGVARTHTQTFRPAGKGVNVSKALRAFGEDSVICGFFGGFTGKYCVDALRKEGFAVQGVKAAGDTRVNVFLTDTDGKEWALPGEGAHVTGSQKGKMMRILENAPDMTCLCLCGSLPTGLDASFYGDILGLCAEKGVPAVLDSAAEGLSALLEKRPYLIKPNESELLDCYGLAVTGKADVKAAMETLHERGAEHILLTLGEKGACFFDGVKTYYANAVRVKVRHTACAGDAALAAFLWEYRRSGDAREALRSGSAAGACAVQSDGVGTLADMAAYRKKADVEVLV